MDERPSALDSPNADISSTPIRGSDAPDPALLDAPADSTAPVDVAAPVAPTPANASNLIDEQSVRDILAGHTEVFAEVVERYKTAVFNLCARMLGDPDDAEDAAQEVFLRAYNQLASYQPGRRFSTWLLSIASHYCIDILRRRRPTTDIENIAFFAKSDLPEPEDVALTSETRREVRTLLQKLPEKYRTVTILRYFNDMSYEEIAEATHLTVGTVKTRLFRARALLADLITQQRAALAPRQASNELPLPAPRQTRTRRPAAPLPAAIPIDSRETTR